MPETLVTTALGKKALIAKRLAQFRQEHGNITQEVLADLINQEIVDTMKIQSKITKATISQWERETFQPDPFLFAALAEMAAMPIKILAVNIRSIQNGLTWQEE